VALCFYVSTLVRVSASLPYLWGVLTLDDITRGPRPLIDHLTTVSAYLNDYKSLTDSKLQDDYSRKFGCYLLSTCWQKIVRRIGSWQAMGFIYFLNGLGPSFIQDRVQEQKMEFFPSRIGLGDKTLIDFLRHASGREGNMVPVIQSLLLDFIPSTEQSEVKRLISISCSNSSVPLFSRDTAPGFHSLVIGVFKSFARAFLQIKKKYEKLVSMDYQALAM
jgi:hypothetical protein